MTDPLRPPIITPIDAAADAVDDDDKSGLPEHELRDAPDAGGGDRTQGPSPSDEDEPLEAPDDPEEVVPTSHLPG
jgi:hypothetical protein